jgi:hypothetical protein
VTEEKFVSQYIKKHAETNIKNFPDDFIVVSDNEILENPHKTLVLGNEFFGNYEILTADGMPFIQAENIHKAKYIVYASRHFDSNIMIPKNDSEIKTAVENYEKYLDWILLDIEESFKIEVPKSPNIYSVSNEIFMKLNMVRY